MNPCPDSLGITPRYRFKPLRSAYPDVDPTHIRFTDLHKWITELPNFQDDPMASTEGKLEAIQMAWLEEYQDNQ